MAITEPFTGTRTMDGTEWSLTNNSAVIAAQTGDGVYQAFVDVSAMAAGDTFQFKIYEKAIAGGTQRALMNVQLSGAQAEPLWVPPTLILINGWDYSVQKIAGTNRSMDWSIRQVA